MESLAVRVDSNFLVSKLCVADFAVSVFSDDQVSGLEFVVLQLCIELLNLCQVVLDLTVLLVSELVIENRAQESDKIAVSGL